MTENALATQVDTELIEKVVIGGDLSKLTATQRMDYYSAVCNSLGLNPLTRPFDYIDLNGKMTLYAKRDAADQLRKIHGISIDKPDIQFTDDLVMVSVTGRDKTGRTDSDLGVVYIGKKTGDPKANAILKAITKAKRRLTLSIVGLGWLDETEVETIPGAVARPVPSQSGAVIDHKVGTDEAKREIANLEPERKRWPSNTLAPIVAKKLAQNTPNAARMLNLSQVIKPSDERALVLEWAGNYRQYRTEHKDEKPADAAAWADEQMAGIETA